MNRRESTRRRRPATSLNRIATVSLIALAATLPAVRAGGSTPSSEVPHAFSSASARPTLDPTASIAKAVQRPNRPWLSAAKDKLVGSVSRFLSLALPDPGYFAYDLHQFDDEYLTPIEDLPLDSGGILDGPGLNWGGSTLEVVRSQAIFLTRSAAFGPRISEDGGLKGFLLPITDFYKVPKDAAFPTSDASGDPTHACPYKGGPGSRRDVLSRYEDEDDRRLYSAFSHSQESSSQSPFVWTHESDTNLDIPKPPHNWIALVERGGGCGFADKVRVAQELGAVAVVVGDAPSPSWNGGRSGDPNEEGDPGLSGKRLITMFAPGDTSDVHIPSTFVTRPSYLDLERLIEETEKDQGDWQKQHPSEQGAPMTRGLEIIISKDDLVWEWPLIDFGIILLLLPSFMTVITIIVHRIRMVRQRRKERAPELVVLGLPCLIWRGNGQPWEKVEGPDVDPGPGNGASVDASGPSPDARPFVSDDLESGRAGETIPLLAEDDNGAGPSQRSHTSVMMPEDSPTATRPVNPSSFLPPGRTYFSTDECAICLCDFVDGDRVRILPCGHIFHRQEVDDWLVRVKKLCPICKRDITVPIPPAPPVGLAATSPAAAAVVTDANGDVQAASAVEESSQEAGDVSQDLVQHLFRDHSDDDQRSQDGRQV